MEWYKKLDESGFDDIERVGKNRNQFFKEYDGYMKHSSAILRKSFNQSTSSYFYLFRNFSVDAARIPKLDRIIAALHGEGLYAREVHEQLHIQYPKIANPAVYDPAYDPSKPKKPVSLYKVRQIINKIRTKILENAKKQVQKDLEYASTLEHAIETLTKIRESAHQDMQDEGSVIVKAD